MDWDARPDGGTTESAADMPAAPAPSASWSSTTAPCSGAAWAARSRLHAGLELVGEADGGEAALEAIERAAARRGAARPADARHRRPRGARAPGRPRSAAAVPRADRQRIARRGRRARRARRRRRRLREQGPGARGHLRHGPARRSRSRVAPRQVRGHDAASQRTTVLVADDHPLYREAVVRAVRARPEFELVGEAGDGREALEAIRADRPDVAVLDVEMPSLRGVDIVDALRRDGLATRVVLLSAHLDSDTVYEAVAGGVSGLPLQVGARRAHLRRDRRRGPRRGHPPRRGPGRPGRRDPPALRTRAPGPEPARAGGPAPDRRGPAARPPSAASCTWPRPR